MMMGRFVGGLGVGALSLMVPMCKSRFPMISKNAYTGIQTKLRQPRDTSVEP